MNFMTEDFLLSNAFAKTLYHNYAKNMPIIDYHCHLSPSDIATDRQFANLTNVWLDGDHYKWRAMRTLGIEEKYITGNAPDEEKFNKWAHTVPYTLRNPLYHWTHLELKAYFGINELLTPDTAKQIYATGTSKLKEPSYRTRGLLTKMNVEVVCTTDDPIDSLGHHQSIKRDNFAIKILPAFRPDKSFAVENLEMYNAYLEKLSKASSTEITSFSKLISALENRIDYFQANGCKLSDHGL